MTIKIINKTCLPYKDIGEMIDRIQDKITTNYVGKWSSYEFYLRDKKYIVETLIMKTCFKVVVRRSENTL